MIPSKVVDKLIIIEIIAVEFPTVYCTFFFFFLKPFFTFFTVVPLPPHREGYILCPSFGSFNIHPLS